MSTRDLLAIVAKRGLKIIVKDGRPVIERPPGNDGVTDKLLAVLKRHREQILEQLK